MREFTIATVGTSPDHRRLLDAAEGRDDIALLPIESGSTVPESVDAVIVDALFAERRETVAEICAKQSAPVLAEFPAVLQAAGAPANLVELNPLCFHAPTRQLLRDIGDSSDPLESVYACWRFQSGGAALDEALLQLLDFVTLLAGDGITRHSVMRRAEPDVTLALLRFANNVVGHLEVGEHLPAAGAVDRELVIECFCRDTVFHCYPEAQSITVEGSAPAMVDWSPPAADAMLDAFLSSLRADSGSVAGSSGHRAGLFGVISGSLDANRK